MKRTTYKTIMQIATCTSFLSLSYLWWNESSPEWYEDLILTGFTLLLLLDFYKEAMEDDDEGDGQQCEGLK